MAKKGVEMEDGVELEAGLPAQAGLTVQAGEPRVYELGFHLDPELPSEEVKKAYQAIRALITERGELVAEGEPEKVALAYTISRQEVAGRHDFSSAYFAWIAYEAPVERHAEVNAAVAADKRIVRFIDLTTDKESARHAAEREALTASVPERPSEPEVAAVAPEEAALDAALEHATV